MKRLTKEEFIEKAKSIHDDKYDYSKVEYINLETKVCIICPKHGEFWQSPIKHLLGQGCPRCVKHGKKTTEIFVEDAKSVHGDKYDYSKVKYISSRGKVCIICPKHGEFLQEAASHLMGIGCPVCGRIKSGETGANTKSVDKEKWIEEARKVHGDKYDYSKVVFTKGGTNNKVCIICPEHGEFWQRATSHTKKGNGCPMCHPNRKKTTEEFIENARAVQGDKYDYSKSVYINNITKLCIICPVHGEFWQTPNSHISRKQGCPKCAQSKLEKKLREILDSEQKNIFPQKTFDWTKNGKRVLRYDFYDDGNNILYECQGIQHIRDCSRAFGEGYFLPLLQRDQEKYKLAQENSIQLVYVVEKRYYKEFLKFGGIYTKENLRKIEI